MSSTYFVHAVESGYNSSNSSDLSINSGLFSKELTNHNREADIVFSGDHGEKKEDYYSLTGHVFLKQDNLSLTANSARMYSSKRTTLKNSESKLGQQGIEYAIAKGDVKILKIVSDLSPEFKANADQVEILIPEHTLVLKGNAKFWRADEFIHAEIMSIDLETNDISLKEPRGTFAAKQMVNENTTKNKELETPSK